MITEDLILRARTRDDLLTKAVELNGGYHPSNLVIAAILLYIEDAIGESK